MSYQSPRPLLTPYVTSLFSTIPKTYLLRVKAIKRAGKSMDYTAGPHVFLAFPAYVAQVSPADKLKLHLSPFSSALVGMYTQAFHAETPLHIRVLA